jgi:hypothetical protein
MTIPGSPGAPRAILYPLDDPKLIQLLSVLRGLRASQRVADGRNLIMCGNGRGHPGLVASDDPRYRWEGYPSGPFSLC